MAIDLMIAHTKVEEGPFPHKWVVTSDSSSYAKTIIIAYCSTETEARRQELKDLRAKVAAKLTSDERSK